MKPNLNPHLRPISVNWENYADDDLAFKQELVTLMIGSLRELQHTVRRISIGNEGDFEKAVHKSKSVLVILGDSEFNGLIEELKLLTSKSSFQKNEKVDRFFQISDALIRSLEGEADIQQAS